MSESEPIDITDTLVYRIFLLLSIAFLAFMFGGVFLGKGSVQFYAMYANLDEEPSTRAAIALGTFGGLLLLWGEIANTLEIIAGKFKFQVAVPRFIKARKILGWSVYGAALAETAAIFVALIYWKIMARLIPAEFFIFAGIGGVAVGFIFAFGKAFGHDSKVGEGRAMSYARAGLMGAAAGFAFLGLSGVLGSVFSGYVPPGSTGDYEAALAVGAVFGLLAMCEHAYRRKELLPLVVLYVALPGVIGGGIAAAVLCIFLMLNGVDVSFPALMIVGAALGASLGVWRRLGPMRNATRMEKFLGVVNFMATGRAAALGIALAFIAAGVVFLWLAVPPFLTFARHRGGPFTLTVAAGGLGLAGYLIVVRGLLPAFLALRGPRIPSDTHGKARWATIGEMRRAGLMPRTDGIYLGQFLDNGTGIDAIGYSSPVHLVTIGRTGSGKGTGLIIPNLSSLRRSILIIDPKGEAAAITARKRAQFGRVVMLNPFNIFAEDRPWMKSHGFNPLATIRMDKNFVADCTIVGQSLIKQEKSREGQFFSTSAHDLTTAFVMHERIMRRENANLANVRAMLTEPWGTDEKGYPTGIARTIAEMTLSDYKPLSQKAGRFRSASNSNRDIISTAINETAFIDDPPVVDDLASTNTFCFSDMKDEIVTVYLILPATHLESHSNWLRLIIASALRELLSTPANWSMPPVLFMLDEFAQLSHLPAISNAMNIARSFGVQLWPFVQDLNQLKDIYQDNWENFLGSSASLTAFAPRDLFTSNYLSNLCDSKTVIVESENVRADPTIPGGGFTPQSQPLIRPGELRAMPAGQLFCLVDPVKQPFMARAPGYWDTAFADGLDDNPYHPR